MDDLIEALQIFAKYTSYPYPTWCETDLLNVDVAPEVVTPEEMRRLGQLGFWPDELGHSFYSVRFGALNE